MILDNCGLAPIFRTEPWMLKEGGALDVDHCPDCWERRAHIERYVWAAKVCRGMNVLDFGCGVGYGSEILQLAGNTVTPVDTSMQALRLFTARRRHLMSCYSNNPYEWEFDACVAFEVLEHLDSPQEFLQTVKARHMIASVPVRAEDTNPHHKQRFTVATALELIGQRFPVINWWLQIEPYHNEPSVVVIHGEVR